MRSYISLPALNSFRSI